MKKIFLFASLAFAAIAVNAQTATTPPDINKTIEFKNAEYNFGQIQTGKPVEYVVEAKNISKDTITLVSAKASCGCTTPNYTPNQKLAPGQVAKVILGFNGGAVGPFTKFADIYFDKGLSKHVTFTGEGVAQVTPAPAAATSTNPPPAKN